jgi:nucleotide-binding universal stress UspA family protein
MAARLARHTGAALHVLYAEDPLMAEAARQAGIDLPHDTAAELQRFVRDTPQTADGSAERHVPIGPAVDEIGKAAERLKADLIVIGSHGMSGAARLVFGSTTEGVLRRSPVSVLVTPATWSGSLEAKDSSGVGPVVAAVDFSPASIAAAKAACGLAGAIGTSVDLVHVVPDPPVHMRWRPHAEAVVRNRTEEARAQLHSLAQTLSSTVPVRSRVEAGDVPDTLAAAAAPSDSRLPILVLGRRPPQTRDGAPGAIAYRVLTLAHVPVLVYVDR